MGFTKLDDELAESSTCRLGLDAVGLWALILSKTKPARDGMGFMRSTPGFFARATGASLERVEELFRIFESPDPESRTRENEGRKIVRVEGGWIVTNYARFRQRADAEEIREYERERKRRQREASVPEMSRTEVGRSASASPSASVSVDGDVGETNFYRPAAADRAERAVTEEIRRLQLILGGKLAELAEHPNSREMVPAWTRRVTAYDRQDGSRANGVADYRTLLSIPRLEKSIEDADYWLAKLEKGPLETVR